MPNKKACVIYSHENQAEASQVAQRLGGEGYEVCATEVTGEEANSIKAGVLDSIPPKVAGCLADAEVCVILVGEDKPAEVGFGGVAAAASDAGCRVVTVGGSPEQLPTELDDVIDGHVPSADSPELPEIISGRPQRIRPDNTPAPERDEDRVKCQ